jgi:hypothetical protein
LPSTELLPNIKKIKKGKCSILPSERSAGEEILPRSQQKLKITDSSALFAGFCVQASSFQV